MTRFLSSPSRWALVPLFLFGCTVSTGTSAPNDAAAPTGDGRPLPGDQGANEPGEPEGSEPADSNADDAEGAGGGDSSPASGPGAMTSPSGQTGGTACAPDKPCPEGMGCSGLFHDKSGQCIPEDQAKAQCEAKGGEWGSWGMRGSRFCNPVHADAGKPCKDGSECAAGVCIADENKPGQGQCQKYGIQYGCYARMNNGKVGQKLCVD